MDKTLTIDLLTNGHLLVCWLRVLCILNTVWQVSLVTYKHNSIAKTITEYDSAWNSMLVDYCLFFSEISYRFLCDLFFLVTVCHTLFCSLSCIIHSKCITLLNATLGAKKKTKIMKWISRKCWVLSVSLLNQIDLCNRNKWPWTRV